MGRLFLSSIVWVKVILLCFFSLQVQAVEWQPLNLYGGKINSLSIDPSTHTTLYATTDNGVYKTINGGQQWARVLKESQCNNVVIALSDTNISYVTTENGVYRTKDGGQEWRKTSDIPADVPSLADFKLAIHPQDAQTIFAGTSDPFSFYVSNDGGFTWWSRRLSGLPQDKQDLLLNGIWVNSNQSPAIYLLLEQDNFLSGLESTTQLYKSTNEGDSWQKLAIPESTSIQGVMLHPNSNDTLYVWDTNNLYKSLNAGSSWMTFKLPDTSSDSSATALTLIPNSNSLYFAANHQFFKGNEIESRLEWQQVVDNQPFLHQLVVNPSDVKQIYAAGVTDESYFDTGDGIYKSPDGGYTWESANTGITNQQIRNITIDPKTPSTIYAYAHRHNVLRSKDSGNTWHTIYEPSTAFFKGDALMNYQVTLHPSDANRLYLHATDRDLFDACQVSSDGSDECSMMSEDAGLTWQQFKIGEDHIGALLFHPTESETLYASKINKNGVYKSTNNGMTWETINSDFYGNLTAISPKKPDILYALYPIDVAAIYKSSNGGQSWREVTTGLTEVLRDYFITQFIMDPVNPDTLYVGTGGSLQQGWGDGVYKSNDAGESWHATNTGLPNWSGKMEITILTIAPSDSTILYAQTRENSFKSINAGKNWTEIETFSATKLSVDPLVAERVYATSSEGIWTLGDKRAAPQRPDIPEDFPFMGTGNAIDAKGKTAKFNSNFSGGISINQGTFQRDSVQVLADQVDVSGYIQTDLEHVGRDVDFVVYAFFKEDGNWYMMDGNNVIFYDPTNPANLKTYRRGTLETLHKLALYQGHFILPGTLVLYFGYRLADGTLVTAPQPIDIKINP